MTVTKCVCCVSVINKSRTIWSNVWLSWGLSAACYNRFVQSKLITSTQSFCCGNTHDCNMPWPWPTSSTLVFLSDSLVLYISVHQEGAGSLRPELLHHGGGRAGDPSLLRRGCVWKRRTMHCIGASSFSTTSSGSSGVSSAHRALWGASSGGHWRPRLQQNPPPQRLRLLSAIHLLLLLLPPPCRDGAGSPGPLLFVILLFFIIMG